MDPANVLPDKTLHDLEWSRIVASIGARCAGPLGSRIVVPIAADDAATRLGLKETAEALAILDRGEVIPIAGSVEIGESLTRLERSGDLDAPSLRDVALVLEAARRCRRFLSASRASAGALDASAAFDASLDGLHDELRSCIDSDGTIADGASAELRRLRGESSNLRGRIVRRLEQMIHQNAAILQDSFHTVREGRHVLPVRRDAHEKLQGIVHGTSASGATVFVEPRALVEQGNRLRMAQAEQEREEARILADLSELVRERLPSMHAAVDSLDHLDLRQASARLGRDLGGVCLEMSSEATIRLTDARHPVLLLDGVDVVASSLQATSSKALIISGPNAGGKTVALKTLGLAALMTRAAVPFPAGEGSVCGFYSNIATDVGDDQSLTKNLSTFSAHITNLSTILRWADGRTLVLLDEVAGGTDPEEGAALACALVDALCRAGAATVLTTHYEALKAMAARDERLENAAVGFDVEAMLPTFELVHGVPGASSALAVALRFGIPENVVEYARRVLPEQSRAFDEVVRELDSQRQELARAQADVEAERRRVAEERANVKAQLEKIAERGQKAVDEESRKLREILRAANQEIKESRRALRKKSDAENIETQRRLVRAAEAVLPEPRVSGEGGGPVKNLTPGQRVYVPRLRTHADVLEGPTRNKVRVAAGPLKLWVKTSELRASTETVSSGAAPRAKPEPVERRVDPQTSDNTLNLRGLRVDDALTLVETFLDRVYGSGGSTAYLAHGLGTGALRDAIREQLSRDTVYAASFRGGDMEEGGERITVVTLR